MTIPLGRPLPDASRDLPGRQRGNALVRHPYLVLLPVGLAVPSPLPETRCALTAPFHLDPPKPEGLDGQTVLCGAIPGVASAGRYPAPCSRGARTFLPSFDERPSGHLTQAQCRQVSALSQSLAFARLRRSNLGKKGREDAFALVVSDPVDLRRAEMALEGFDHRRRRHVHVGT